MGQYHSCHLRSKATLASLVTDLSRFPLVTPASSQRQQLYEMAGAGQTPYLVDPNTGAKGYESSEINDYLELTYAL